MGRFPLSALTDVPAFLVLGICRPVQLTYQKLNAACHRAAFSSKSSQVNGRNLITLPQKKRAARRRQLKYTGISGG
jgi:hypothetical protein